MTLTVFLAYAGLIVWLFPPIKQYKTEYFYYFLVNAAVGPVLIVCGALFAIKTNYLFPSGYLFSLAFLTKEYKRIIFALLAVIAAFAFPIFKPANGILFGLTTIVALANFMIILFSLFDRFVKTHQINLFLSLMFVYMAIDVVKLFDITVNLHLGYVYYYFGVGAQLLFGIAFLFINVNTKNFKVSLKAIEEI